MTPLNWTGCMGLVLLMGCGEAPVVNSSYTPPNRTYQYCVNQSSCPEGFVCEDQICKVGVNNPNPPVTDTNTPPPPGQCNNQYPCPVGLYCINGYCQIQTPPDTQTTVPDTQPNPPDTMVMEDVPPPPPDTCTYPGDFASCTGIELCRVDDLTGALFCSSSSQTNPKNAPCTSHQECDLLYGCHFGICTTYCEIQFGDTQCPPGETCQKLLHPQWGACVP